MNKKFDELVAEISELLQALEDSNMPLEESIEIYKKGIVLVKDCFNILQKVENDVQILTDELDKAAEPFNIFDNQ